MSSDSIVRVSAEFAAGERRQYYLAFEYVSGGTILRQLRLLLFIGATIITLSACIYRMDIPQGNRIDPVLVEQLEIGMSRSQVRFLLGTPAIVDLYHPDQWHYVFYLKTSAEGNYEKRVMSLTFQGDLLADIEGTLNPG